MMREELVRLHFINALFSGVTGHDLYLARQIKQGIEAALREQDPTVPPHDLFYQAAAQLLERHFRQKPAHGFAHWHAGARGTGFHPLWARQELIGIFKKLSPCPRATVLITNLRGAICPPGRRWSPRLRAEYAETIDFIRSLAANWSRRRANLVLLFL